MKTHYPFLISDDVLYVEFEFKSDGPNGTITKVVRYELQNSNGSTFFDLRFGDWNDETKTLSYSSVSNNKDRDKILATVAETALKLTREFPDLAVIAAGSTSGRTRLYQMMISTNLESIEKVFVVHGYQNKEWEPFKRNIKYEAFAIQRR